MCETAGAMPSEVLTGDANERLLRSLVVGRMNRQAEEYRRMEREW